MINDEVRQWLTILHVAGPQIGGHQYSRLAEVRVLPSAGMHPNEQDPRRKAQKLLEAQRWREAVRTAEAGGGTPPDELLCPAVEGLAARLRQVRLACTAAVFGPQAHSRLLTSSDGGDVCLCVSKASACPMRARL